MFFLDRVFDQARTEHRGHAHIARDQDFAGAAAADVLKRLAPRCVRHADVETELCGIHGGEGYPPGVGEACERIALHEREQMKPIDREFFAAGVDGVDDHAPLGLVFPEALERNLADIEAAAPPIGGGGHAAPRQQGERQHGGDDDQHTRRAGVGETTGVEKSHGEKITGSKAHVPSDSRVRVWWCNADFDLTLAHGGGKMPAKIRQAAEAPTWALSFWPALAPDDILLLPSDGMDSRSKALEDFRAYLARVGLHAPRILPVDDFKHNTCVHDGRVPHLFTHLFTPFGWNMTAVDTMKALSLSVRHPDPTAVKHVNSRAFSAALEQVVSGEEACPAVFCASRRAVKAWLETAPPGRYVAKGNHGLAGIGQVRFTLGLADTSGLSPDEATDGAKVSSVGSTLSRLADRHEGLVIEEECAVTREWGVLFRVGRDGRRSTIRRHRLMTGTGGSYAGALVLPDDQARAETDWFKYRDRAYAAVDAVAAALHREGYWGPVGLDMFLYERAGAISLRPLVDLNARQSMAWPVHGLAARFPGRAVLFRQFSATSLELPERADTLQDILSFDANAWRGVLWLTPLLPLARVSVAFIGRDEADVLALQHEFLEHFSRR